MKRTQMLRSLQIITRVLTLVSFIYGLVFISGEQSGWAGFGFITVAVPILLIGHVIAYIKLSEKPKLAKIVLAVLYILVSLFSVVAAFWQFG